MNRKFSTLMAIAMLATGANGWAQVVIDKDVTTGGSAHDLYTVQSTAFTRFVLDQSSAVGDKKFPTVSPFKICTEYGAKPINQLNKVNGESDGRYFQFVVGTANSSEVLTMNWVSSKGYYKTGEDKVYKDAAFTTEGSNPVAGHYEVQVENVENANIPANRITLDRTLWKVKANKDAAGTVLYYELQNKATNAILQLSTENVERTFAATSSLPAASEVSLQVVNGQTNWRWADGQTASLASKVEATTAGVVLQNTLRASFSNNMTIHLVKKTYTPSGGTPIVTLGAIMLNSNEVIDPATGIEYTMTNGDKYKYESLTFEAWEANPIILDADQINSELGNDVLLTEGERTNGFFHFEFDPEVQGDENVMTASDFVAVAPANGYDRLPGDTPDGFVRFKKKGTSDQYLRVDTTYYDPNANGSYDLKMTVGQILYPRFAVAHDGLGINADGDLTAGGSKMSPAQIYGDFNSTVAAAKISKAPYTSRVYVQLKRQSNFRPIFYPATQSLRLQAEMIYKAEKKGLNATGADYQPWWMQMAEDAVFTDNSDAAATPDANFTDPTTANAVTFMKIAECASVPATSPIYKPAAARGYYPAYTQIITYTAGVADVEQGLRLTQYRNAWGVESNDRAKRNGYAADGTLDITLGTPNVNKMVWNAVGNVLQGSAVNTTAFLAGVALANTDFVLGNDKVANAWVVDPASTVAADASKKLAGYAAAGTISPREPKMQVVYAPQYALANSNLASLVSLTPSHVVLTAAVHDKNDEKYNGLNTYITLKTTKAESDLEEVAEIPQGFYYIRNAKKMASDLTKEGDYRYEDLAATNAMFTYWNAMTLKWDRATSGLFGADATAEGINISKHKADKANIGNLVYSEDKKVIPSAQWYIKGNGGYYTIYNRESGRVWGTSYWWKTSEPNVYANMATYYDAAGLKQTYRDTIRIEAIPLAELTDRTMGYLNMTQAQAIADTSVYSIGMTSLGDVRFSLSSENGVLKMIKDAKGDYKMERVLIKDKDLFSQKEVPTSELIYGYVPELGAGVDTTKMLVRAKYYIYKDEVNANSGIEPSSIKTRQYITLESGKYRLTPVKVQFDNNLYSTNLDADEMSGTESVKNRRAFYVKQISTEDPTQFVLVDPMVVTQTENGSNKTTAYGARLFTNQLTAEVQPSGLISDGYANSYATSIFNVEKQQAFNYKDLRGEFSRDTLEFFKADDTAADYLLSENTGVKGSNVGLLESLDKRLNKNNALFVDTANVSRPECVRFLLGLRNVDTYERNSSIEAHNRHLYTDADYLVNMIDSVSANSTYLYKNIDQNSTKYYRLGFVGARHEGSKLTFDKSGAVYDLSDAALGANKLNYATFAFRFCDADRENFYIETMYDKNTRGWLKTINHVLVVTPEIQEAEVFQAKKSESTPTANDEITASNVTVEGGNGIVIIKGASAKQVTVCNVLGQTLVSTVLSSDEATIAVPAGIVVVAVEGEAAVKAVVK